ncbi:peptidoglycan editing factor PgeF [Maribellus sediminis]|uniref:peptidoglycan editing factor PgeF n=1 Tax=Maribellus sediminis TaxID=2696285 RepID=UPI001431C125|nr:peptidoglycan editing factor PgeF [Maribellus sediminis]
MANNNFIRYRIFEAHPEIEAFTTSKQSLTSAKARFTGDEENGYQSNREELSRHLGIETDKLVFPRQTHTSTVCCIDDIPETEISETDALVSDKKGLCLCVQTADCVPVLLFDPVKKVVAAVHAGWRGTVGKIVANAISKMTADYASNPADILAAIGPSIGPEVYEVGNEVVTAAQNAIPNAAQTLHLNSLGNYHFNLWEANRLILLECGLQNSNIEVLAECSFEYEQKYYSARRDGADTGRMVSGIMLL